MLRVMANPPRIVDHAIARIRAYARHRGWKKSRLASEAGMQDTTLRDFDKEGWNPTADTLRRLEAIVPPDFMPAGAPSAAPRQESAA